MIGKDYKIRECSLVHSVKNYESASAGRKPSSTGELLDSEKEKRASTDEGRKFRSRAVAARLKKQSDALKHIATDVHHGTKKDLIQSIAASISRSKSVLEGSTWNGQLTVEDVTLMTKLIDVPKSNKTLYELLTKVKSAEEYYLSAEDILFIKDQASSTDTFRFLQRKFPGFFASEAKEELLRKKWHNECKVLLNPQRTGTGWKVDIDVLSQLLRLRYYWLPEQEWWCLYIDARNYGGSKTCTIELSVLNNEAVFHDVGFHSPDHYWPVQLMYGDDSRENLDLNLGGPDNYLNSWISKTQENGHKVYLSADSVCMDSVCGGGLVATSTDKFNVYNYETVHTKSEVGPSGFRSELKRGICREHPESLLPALPTEHIILCSNHMMSRVTEHLVTSTVLSVMDEEATKNITTTEREARLQHFVENINKRGVRSGQFKLKFEGNKLEPITLNTTHAETISSPPELIGQEYCRKDPDPRLRENCRDSESELQFGLDDSEINEYQHLADLFHALILFRYGPQRLVPYVVKRVDIVPILLRDLPWHGLMRGSTEGGERSHYRDQCWFYGHSSRGGGWTKSDPILNVFLLMYRRLREQMRDQPKEIQDKFEEFVAKKLAEAENKTQTTMESDEADQANETEEVTSEAESFRHNQTDTPAQKKLKRGDRICYNGSPGNFLTYTPSKTNGSVILRGDNTRPLRIPLIDIQPGRKLAFDGQYFIVAGKFCQVSTLPCWHNTGLNNTNFNRLTHCMSTK